MINLIGNGCFSTFCLKDFIKQPYTNPFVWNVIKYEDMMLLIKNYDRINWENIKFEKTKDDYFIGIIDNLVKIHYIHFKFSKTDDYTVRDHNVYSKNMHAILQERYKKWITLMQDKPPVFAVANSNKTNYYSDEQLKELEKACKKYPLIIIKNKTGNTKAAQTLYNILKKKGII